ncbi:MAG: hypothetical protein DRJ63_01130 [Thermoprotei archaeon]|nr:MAG: hypothetical protein DRJ63_01130 [Thermoprotei archaeon]
MSKTAERKYHNIVNEKSAKKSNKPNINSVKAFNWRHSLHFSRERGDLMSENELVSLHCRKISKKYYRIGLRNIYKNIVLSSKFKLSPNMSAINTLIWGFEALLFKAVWSWRIAYDV